MLALAASPHMYIISIGTIFVTFLRVHMHAAVDSSATIAMVLSHGINQEKTCMQYHTQ
jgi:hypothetical protein